MKQYWEVPGNIAIISTILDPRLKKLRFFENERDISDAIMKLRNIWNVENNRTNSTSMNEDQQQSTSSGSSSFFEDIFDDSNQEREETPQDEISSYIQLPIEKKNCDPLGWWQDRATFLPTLYYLAKKYLSVPATSVPSERLFSDAGMHLSAKRTCLSSDLLSKMLFLKRNHKNYDIFGFYNE